MKEIFHCSNCGAILENPDDSCAQCGYQRESSFHKQTLCRVILTNPGKNPARVFLLLNLQTGLNRSKWQDIVRNIPAMIFETTDCRAAKNLAARIEQAGGMAAVEYSTGSGSDTHGMEPEAVKPSPPVQKTIGRLIPIIIVVLALLGPLFSKFDFESLKEFKQHFRDILEQNQSGGFDTVRIIIASRDIQAGETITMDMLRSVPIEREKAPDGAVAPLNVESLIGQSVPREIPNGSIIILN
ncbi:hypothetical protein JXA40_08840 [bacterium]|nr:hypothetical protein [candidate division CSSED10-310 bacterium]